MSNLYNWIERRCAEKGIKVAQMCADVGIRQSVISDLKHDRTKSFSAKTAVKLAEYFDTDPMEIMGYAAAEPTRFFRTYKSLCERKGVSVNAVAQGLGISSGSVTAWKHGRIPKQETIEAIADYFGVDIEAFFRSGAELQPAGEKQERPELQMLLSLVENESREFVEKVILIAQWVKYQEGKR